MLCVVIKKKLNPPNQTQSKPPANNPIKSSKQPKQNDEQPKPNNRSLCSENENPQMAPVRGEASP
jgi:hypothetical protein